VWFGVLLAVNMQTSFLHPPFGFALFYLRSVAPPSVRTGDIYWAAIPFVVIQVLMVATVIAVPSLVTGNVTAAATVKGTGEEELRRQLQLDQAPAPSQEPKEQTPQEGAPPSQGEESSGDSASEIERALRGGK
jgi:hypothetical protein